MSFTYMDIMKKITDSTARNITFLINNLRVSTIVSLELPNTTQKTRLAVYYKKPKTSNGEKYSMPLDPGLGSFKERYYLPAKIRCIIIHPKEMLHAITTNNHKIRRLFKGNRNLKEA